MSEFLELGPDEPFKTFIRVTLDSDAPAEYVIRWKQFRKSFLDLSDNAIVPVVSRDDIFLRWKQNCSLESNRQLPLLDRCEGGLGNNDNRTSKQIRPIMADTLDGKYFLGLTDEVRLSVTDGINYGSERWNLDEIKDLLDGLLKTCNYYTDSQGCRAQIILEYIN